jgi:hypothetical protein
MIEHDGGVSGFSSYALRMPADRVYVAFLLNSRDNAKFPETLGMKIAGLDGQEHCPESVHRVSGTGRRDRPGQKLG